MRYFRRDGTEIRQSGDTMWLRPGDQELVDAQYWATKTIRERLEAAWLFHEHDLLQGRRIAPRRADDQPA